MRFRFSILATLIALAVIAIPLGVCSRLLTQARLAQAEATRKELSVQTMAQAITESVNKADPHTPRSDAPLPSDLKFITWNIQSGGNDPATIARQLVELGRYDAYALQEVRGQNFGRYHDSIRRAHGKGYRYVASLTGRSDRLMIIFDSDRLKLVEVRELFEGGVYTLNDWRHRSPLVAVFRDTTNEAKFGLVTVHLARGSEKLRTEQAAGLRAWAARQHLPLFGIGDFNMDYEFANGKGNKAFDAFLTGGVWDWIEPDELIDTN